MNIYRCKYRTKDGAADYGFSFVEIQDDNWRIYIDDQPSYNGRPTDAESIHRLTDENGRNYVCWKGILTSLENAKTIAALWADKTQIYIKTGQPIVSR
jgi:hypothetical protein